MPTGRSARGATPANTGSHIEAELAHIPDGHYVRTRAGGGSDPRKTMYHSGTPSCDVRRGGRVAAVNLSGVQVGEGLPEWGGAVEKPVPP